MGESAPAARRRGSTRTRILEKLGGGQTEFLDRPVEIVGDLASDPTSTAGSCCAPNRMVGSSCSSRTAVPAEWSPKVPPPPATPVDTNELRASEHRGFWRLPLDGGVCARPMALPLGSIARLGSQLTSPSPRAKRSGPRSSSCVASFPHSVEIAVPPCAAHRAGLVQTQRIGVRGVSWFGRAEAHPTVNSWGGTGGRIRSRGPGS